VPLIEVIGGDSVASWQLECHLWRCKCLLLAVRVPFMEVAMLLLDSKSVTY